MPNTYDHGGEPDGLPMQYGQGREKHRPSKAMQAYYDRRDPPEADDPTPEQDAANRLFIAMLHA